MIRNHRPRGYAWNCASDFQQTPLFRLIPADDNAAGDHELLCPDSEDEWPLSERAAKRRRVTQLAHLYLDGFELQVLSARPDPHAFAAALAYSFPRPKDAARALAAIHLHHPPESNDDEPNPWQVLKAYNEAVAGHSANGPSVPDPSGIMHVAHELTVAHVEMRSGCHRRRSRRLIKLALAASEHVSRNRRAGVSVQGMAESQPQSCPRRVVQETNPIPQSAAETLDAATTSFSDCGPSPTPAWTSSKWLRSGTFQAPKKRVDEDCSKDELALSSFSIASQQARSRAVTSSAQCQSGKRRRARIAKSAGNTPGAVTEQPLRRSTRRRTAPGESQQAAFEHSELSIDQRRRPRAQRFEYNEAVGGKDTSPFVFRKRASKDANGSGTGQEIPMPSRHASTRPIITPRRPIKCASDGVARREQHPPTPLVDEHRSGLLPRANGTDRRSLTLRRSLRNQMRALGPEISKAAADEPSSQPGPESQRHGHILAGVNGDEKRLSQHRGPPADDEKRLSQHRGPSSDDEKLSSHHSGSPADGESVAERIPSPQLASIVEPQLPLPGTQAMLDQAHHDLFTSPEKTDSDLCLGDRTTPGALPNTSTARRKPLGALSQERMPMPSTQALLNEWPGWSSVKKPQGSGKRSNLDAWQSPTVSMKESLGVTASNPKNIVDRRRSSLRYAMSFAESPAKTQSPKPSSRPVQCYTAGPDASKLHEPQSFSAAKPSGKIASSATFSLISSIETPSASFSASTRAAAPSTVVENVDSLSFGSQQPRQPTEQRGLRMPDDGSRGFHAPAVEKEHAPLNFTPFHAPAVEKKHAPPPNLILSGRPRPPSEVDRDERDHDLSFAAPLALKPAENTPKPTQPDRTILNDVSAYDAATTLDFDAPTPSYIRDHAPPPSRLLRRDTAWPVSDAPAAAQVAADGEFDSQQLSSALDTLTADVLGHTCGWAGDGHPSVMS